jgi:rhodanese-related sulfurtransferase
MPQTSILRSILLIYLLTISLISSAASISGKVINGLRILDVPTNKTPLKYQVYRGDYIKFSSLKQPEIFQLAGLKYKEKVLPNLKNSNYFKMKEVGVFDFKLGKREGKITVVEYQQANYKAISAKESKELIDSIKPLLLDVRTSAEYHRGHISGSTLMPVQVVQFKASELEQYKNQDILIYCASGNRSTVAAKILIDQGFKRIYNMRFGLIDWVKSGYPLSRQ